MYRCTVAVLLLLVVVTTVTQHIPAYRGQFPHQVEVRHAGQFRGSGSIIRPRWILTTATCVEFIQPSMYTIVAGALRLVNDGQIYQVDKRMVHEDYYPFIGNHNVALLRLSEDIAFGDYVKAIAFTGPFVDAVSAVTSGWGPSNDTATDSKELVSYDTTTITYEDCKDHFGSSADQVNNNTLCTFFGNETCIGDMSAQLEVNGQLAGMLSWVAIECDVLYPKIFTRVSSFVPWIIARIGE